MSNNRWIGLILTVALLLVIGLLVYSSNAKAEQYVIKVSTGGEKGTYHSFYKSIETVCGESDKYQLNEVGSSGSDENIANLAEKVANAAFTQLDVLQYLATTTPGVADNVRLLVPLYPEEVHVIALADLSKTEGGLSSLGSWTKKLGVGGTTTALTSLSQLDGLDVGAWGGSYTTARAIAHFGAIKYNPVQVKDSNEGLAKLNSGQVAALIVVGGQPMQFVKELPKKYKLLKIDSSLASRVKVYQPTLVNYRNLGTEAVETVAPRSALVVRNWTSPGAKEAFSALKQCISDKYETFNEGSHHAKWGEVKLDADSTWPRYETIKTSSSKVTTTESATTAKKAAKK